jgi:hypothetical protein
MSRSLAIVRACGGGQLERCPGPAVAPAQAISAAIATPTAGMKLRLIALPWAAVMLQRYSCWLAVSTSYASSGLQVAEDEAVAFDGLAGLASDWLSEDRPGMGERVELAVLTTRIDARGQIA